MKDTELNLTELANAFIPTDKHNNAMIVTLSKRVPSIHIAVFSCESKLTEFLGFTGAGNKYHNITRVSNVEEWIGTLPEDVGVVLDPYVNMNGKLVTTVLDKQLTTQLNQGKDPGNN